MTTPQAVINAFMEAAAVKDWDKAMGYLAEDCVYTNIPLGTVHGPAAARGVLEPFFAPTLENQFMVERSAVHGATVFVERIDRHRLKDKWVELPVVGVFEVRDGRIVLWRDYFDAATIMNAWPSA